MFEGINQIDWASLGNRNIPRLLRNLISNNGSIRSQAYENLMETVVDAEAGFELSNARQGLSMILKSDLQLLLVPFLIEVLDIESIQDKSYEYEILICFVEYVDFMNDGEIYHQRACQIKKAVWKEKDVYIKQLYHKNTNTRWSAFSLLCSFNEYSTEIIPILLERIKSEANEDIKLTFARNFYHAMVLLELLSDDEMNIWKDIAPLPPEQLFTFYMQSSYKKHDCSDS